MPKFKPVHGVILVVTILAVLLLLESGLRGTRYTRVAAGTDDVVRIGVVDLGRGQIRYYRYLSPANQEADFFVARDSAGTVQVAFDASESHYKLRRGFRLENDWIVDNKCDTVTRLSAVNAGGGGCSPIPLPHRLNGDEIVIDPADLLQGWRLFR